LRSVASQLPLPSPVSTPPTTPMVDNAQRSDDQVLDCFSHKNKETQLMAFFFLCLAVFKTFDGTTRVSISSSAPDDGNFGSIK